LEQPGEKVTVGTADGLGSEKIFKKKHSYYFYALLFKPLKTKIIISIITASVKYRFKYIILIHIKKKNI
jgi:hypothetical protein